MAEGNASPVEMEEIETMPWPPPPPPPPPLQKKAVESVRGKLVDVEVVDVEEETEKIELAEEEDEEEQRRHYKLEDAEEEEQSEHVYSVAPPAEVEVVAAEEAFEMARLTAATARFEGLSREEAGAILIQTAFRGYLARRALRALRGLVRLKSLVHGSAIKRQTANTLHCMQTLARVQSQIRSRRIRMTEENQAFQRQLLLKRERELERLRIGEEWDDSLRSKEQIEANLLNKHEAAIRRERALAYAFSHQWKSSSRSVNPMFMDPNNPQWGWSWLERWMSARPWESRCTACHEIASNNNGVEIAKTYARRDSHSERTSAYKSSRSSSRQSPVTPTSKASSVTGRTKPASPISGLGDDSRSTVSLKMEWNRRHSVGGFSMTDDDSLPSYMTPTKSAKVKSRYQTLTSDKFESSGSVGSMKKRLSFHLAENQNVHSPVRARRHSVPPKVDIASLKEVSV